MVTKKAKDNGAAAAVQGVQHTIRVFTDDSVNSQRILAAEYNDDVPTHDLFEDDTDLRQFELYMGGARVLTGSSEGAGEADADATVEEVERTRKHARMQDVLHRRLRGTTALSHNLKVQQIEPVHESEKGGTTLSKDVQLHIIKVKPPVDQPMDDGLGAKYTS